MQITTEFNLVNNDFNLKIWGDIEENSNESKSNW
jgi:hypothetical protein